MATHDEDCDRVEQRFADTNMSSSTYVGSDGSNFYGVERKFSNVEKGGSTGSSSNSAGSVHIKLDSKGFPLVPQPSHFKDDPLVSFTRFLRNLEMAILTCSRTGRRG
jgi:hypothetical protein